MKEKIKTISKYFMNIMAFTNAILIGLSPIWGWNLDKVTDSIAVLIGIIGAWLVGGKLFETKEEVEIQTTFNTNGVDILVDEGVVENVYNENNETSK